MGSKVWSSPEENLKKNDKEKIYLNKVWSKDDISIFTKEQKKKNQKAADYIISNKDFPRGFLSNYSSSFSWQKQSTADSNKLYFWPFSLSYTRSHELRLMTLFNIKSVNWLYYWRSRRLKYITSTDQELNSTFSGATN